MNFRGLSAARMGKAAVRNARTMCTSAENRGSVDCVARAADMGIIQRKRWIATRDARIRDWHRELDGVKVDPDEAFENSLGRIEYPGDYSADPANVWNCRCCLAYDTVGFKGVNGKTVMLDGNEGKPLTAERESGKIEEKDEEFPEINGVTRGTAMPHEEADMYKTNPNYGKPGYNINCQTCAPTYEARRRGYDVVAMANINNPYAKELSRHTNLIWIDPNTGEHPEYIQDTTKKTAKQYLNFINETIAQGERYSMQFVWKGRGFSGHIVNVDRDDSGQLRIVDNQRGANEKNTHIGETEVLAYLSRMKYMAVYQGNIVTVQPKLLRIDNMEFDYDLASKIMEAAK